MSNDHQIDPTEFFGFLESHDDYPISGQSLAQEARAEGSEPELVEFLEALPTVGGSDEIVEHAVNPDAAPFGEHLDLSGNNLEQEVVPDIAPEATLEFSDIVSDDKR